MAIIIRTRHPRELREQLIERIFRNIITTWIIDEENDITINNPRWRFKAWFTIYFEEQRIVFGILSSIRYDMTRELYGVYHGRLAATLLANFDDMIDRMEVTSGYSEQYDRIH